eukprot:gene5923-biopygen5395
MPWHGWSWVLGQRGANPFPVPPSLRGTGLVTQVEQGFVSNPVQVRFCYAFPTPTRSSLRLFLKPPTRNRKRTLNRARRLDHVAAHVRAVEEEFGAAMLGAATPAETLQADEVKRGLLEAGLVEGLVGRAKPVLVQ